MQVFTPQNLDTQMTAHLTFRNLSQCREHYIALLASTDLSQTIQRPKHASPEVTRPEQFSVVWMKQGSHPEAPGSNSAPSPAARTCSVPVSVCIPAQMYIQLSDTFITIHYFTFVLLPEASDGGHCQKKTIHAPMSCLTIKYK